LFMAILILTMCWWVNLLCFVCEGLFFVIDSFLHCS
jgi:hypothetical protein